MSHLDRTAQGARAPSPAAARMLPGFRFGLSPGAGADIHYASAGDGPPLLLIHGNPLSLVSWHKVAPSLARDFTVVAMDLRGYGDSGKPDGGEDHAAYTFRAMAEDGIALMRTLGFERFSVAGHDRGARVAFRMALDHPESVARMAALDIVPTHHVLSNITLGWGLESYHWFFMAQKAPFPEKLICADLDYYMRYKLNKKGVGLDIFTEDAMSEYVRCATPEQTHAVCEDYRATVTLDLAMDRLDYGNRQIECPVLVIWGSNSHVGRYFRTLEAWKPWAPDLRGFAVPSGHYPAEQHPDLIAPAFADFFSGREPAAPAA